MLSAVRRRRLVRQLQAAREALAAWDDSLRLAAGHFAPAGDSTPVDATVLLRMIADARAALDSRLRELGAEFLAPAPSAALPRSTSRVKIRARTSPRSPEPRRVCVNACRACGRALGTAFRAAQRVADPASARVLYPPLRALEKQMWLLDPRQPG